eukprot:TRINITY_DN871_c0_g1_i5.p1 TRINITY_DN871_c0_g1~~TRINITY_DN871_c0_g1_i5.p1  ORF type:complete len:159 (-),score=33.77 TRINITY_DN871_c0_g1_i5:445-921(-)
MYPALPCMQGVELTKLHLYTAIQLICFSILLVMTRVDAVAAFFPFFLVLIGILRPLLPHIFTKHELEVLDSSSVEDNDAASLQRKKEPQEDELRRRTSQQRKMVDEDGSNDHNFSLESKDSISDEAVNDAATQTKKVVDILPDLEGLAVGIDETVAGS